MDKRWLTPPNDRAGSHLELFLKIQHVYGQKMIDPPCMTDQDLNYNFKADLACTWSKMIDRGGDCYTKDLLPARVTTCYSFVLIVLVSYSLVLVTQFKLYLGFIKEGKLMKYKDICHTIMEHDLT